MRGAACPSARPDSGRAFSRPGGGDASDDVVSPGCDAGEAKVCGRREARAGRRPSRETRSSAVAGGTQQRRRGFGPVVGRKERRGCRWHARPGRWPGLGGRHQTCRRLPHQTESCDNRCGFGSTSRRHHVRDLWCPCKAQKNGCSSLSCNPRRRLDRSHGMYQLACLGRSSLGIQGRRKLQPPCHAVGGLLLPNRQINRNQRRARWRLLCNLGQIGHGMAFEPHETAVGGTGLWLQIQKQTQATPNPR